MCAVRIKEILRLDMNKNFRMFDTELSNVCNIAMASLAEACISNIDLQHWFTKVVHDFAKPDLSDKKKLVPAKQSEIFEKFHRKILENYNLGPFCWLLCNICLSLPRFCCLLSANFCLGPACSYCSFSFRVVCLLLQASLK